MDIFNTLNHPNFSNPNTNFNSTTFGQVTGTTPFGGFSGPRGLRFGARITF